MHVIAYPKLREFAEKYPKTKNALDRWFKTLSKNNYGSQVGWATLLPTRIDRPSIVR